MGEFVGKLVEYVEIHHLIAIFNITAILIKNNNYLPALL